MSIHGEDLGGMSWKALNSITLAALQRREWEPWRQETLWEAGVTIRMGGGLDWGGGQGCSEKQRVLEALLRQGQQRCLMDTTSSR